MKIWKGTWNDEGGDWKLLSKDEKWIQTKTIENFTLTGKEVFYSGCFLVNTNKFTVLCRFIRSLLKLQMSHRRVQASHRRVTDNYRRVTGDYRRDTEVYFQLLTWFYKFIYRPSDICYYPIWFVYETSE